MLRAYLSNQTESGDQTVNPADLSIIEAGERLRTGSLTSVALMQACLDRIAQRDPAYHAFVPVDAERALEAAQRRRDLQRAGEKIKACCRASRLASRI